MAKRKVESGPTQTPAEYLEALIKEFPKKGNDSLSDKFLEKTNAGKNILAQDREVQADIVRAALDRLEILEAKIAELRSKSQFDDFVFANWEYNLGSFPVWDRWLMEETLRGLLRRNLPFNEADLIKLVKWPLNGISFNDYYYPLRAIVGAIENFVKKNEISENLRQLLEKFSGSFCEDERRLGARMATVLPGAEICIAAGEAWSDVALDDLNKMDASARKAWNALLACLRRKSCG